MSARLDLTTEELIAFVEQRIAKLQRLSIGGHDVDCYRAIAQRLRSERPAVTPEMVEAAEAVLDTMATFLLDHAGFTRSARAEWKAQCDRLRAALSVSSTEGKQPGEGNG